MPPLILDIIGAIKGERMVSVTYYGNRTNISFYK